MELRFVRMKSHSLFQVEINAKSKNILLKFKNLSSPEPQRKFQPNLTWNLKINLLLLNQRANFHSAKSILGGGEFKFVQMKGKAFFPSENTLTKFKKIFYLQNLLVNFNQTWHTSFLDKGNSCLFKEIPRPFSRGDNIK